MLDERAFYQDAPEIGKNLLIAAVVLFVFFKVLRPMFRTAMTPPPVVETPETSSAARGALPAPANQPPYQNSLDSAKQLARQEPALVANIVRSWVAGDER